MTAWVKAGSEEVVGIITDFVDPAVTEFNKALVDRYRSFQLSLPPSPLLLLLLLSLTFGSLAVSIPYKETLCGYA